MMPKVQYLYSTTDQRGAQMSCAKGFSLALADRVEYNGGRRGR
jgi:hypothetical protein